MKKFLFASILAASFVSPSFAEGDMYLRFGVSSSRFVDFKDEDFTTKIIEDFLVDQLGSNVTLNQFNNIRDQVLQRLSNSNFNLNQQVKFKSNNYPSIDFAFGYNLSPQARVELNLNHSINKSFKTKTFTTQLNTIGIAGLQTLHDQKLSAYGKIDLTSTSISARSFYDFYNFGSGKLYVGGGLGVSKTKLKTKIIENGKTLFEPKSKSAIKPFGSVHLGSSFDLSEKVKLDLGYSFQLMKSAKFKLDNRSPEIRKTFKSHSLSLSLRYNI